MSRPGRRLRYLMRIHPNDGKDGFLPLVRSLASSVGADALNPKWTSKGSLELDIFTLKRGDIYLLTPVLEPLGTLEFVKDLNVASPHLSPSEAVAEARRLFNAERYWESHEVLEGLWRTLHDPDKSFVQGVILICAAFVHHQKGDDTVALGLLKRAETQLTGRQGMFYGIAPDELLAHARSAVATGEIVGFEI